jgi:hypothetical protein
VWVGIDIKINTEYCSKHLRSDLPASQKNAYRGNCGVDGAGDGGGTGREGRPLLQSGSEGSHQRLIIVPSSFLLKLGEHNSQRPLQLASVHGGHPSVGQNWLWMILPVVEQTHSSTQSAWKVPLVPGIPGSPPPGLFPWVNHGAGRLGGLFRLVILITGQLWFSGSYPV